MPSEQLAGLIAGLRATGPDFSKDPIEVRAEFEAMLATIPLASDLSYSETQLSHVPVIHSSTPEASDRDCLLYLHGGAYTVGSARGYLGLSSELARAAGMTCYSVDYRLAPENRFPWAVNDSVEAYIALLAGGVEPSRIAIAGDSAGGGLALATLVALRDADLPLPSCAVLLSPWADLSCENSSLEAKRAEDPSLTPEGLRAMAGHYLGEAAATEPLASPIQADLTGLPPLLIQVGSAEILLDDAIAVARRAGTAGSKVQLEVWPQMIHVWQAFHFLLPEGRAAIEAAANFIKIHIEAA